MILLSLLQVQVIISRRYMLLHSTPPPLGICQTEEFRKTLNVPEHTGQVRGSRQASHPLWSPSCEDVSAPWALGLQAEVPYDWQCI